MSSPSTEIIFVKPTDDTQRVYDCIRYTYFCAYVQAKVFDLDSDDPWEYQPLQADRYGLSGFEGRDRVEFDEDIYLFTWYKNDKQFIFNLVNIFISDGTLPSLIEHIMGKDEARSIRAQDELQRLLNRCASEFRTEIPGEDSRVIAYYLSIYSTIIAKDIFRRAASPHLRHLRELEGRWMHSNIIEAIGSERLPKEARSHIRGIIEDIEVSGFTGPSSQGIEAEEYNDEFHEFHGIDVAFGRNGALGYKLENLLARWLRPDHKCHDLVAQYELVDLTRELELAVLEKIRIGRDEEVGIFRKSINRRQNAVESWTGERWDWWPLPQCVRDPGENETQIRWEYICGENGRAVVPSQFAEFLKSIVHDPGQSRTLTQNSPPPPAQNPPPDQGSPSNAAVSKDGGNNSSSPQNFQGSCQKGTSSSTDSGSTSSQPQKVNPTSSSYVLLFVEKGNDFKVAQIRIEQADPDGDYTRRCQTFFHELKKSYLCLRGFFRNWFSIWRYSHCEFYKFQQFQIYEFDAMEPNAFPQGTDAEYNDYDFYPKPMLQQKIPPVSKREFNRRFYACYQPRPHLHFYHDCKKLSGHTRNVLERSPKKKANLKAGGTAEEFLWGLYARENPSALRVFLYIIGCLLLPTVFFSWILPAGPETDLQNPSVPFGMMLGLLALVFSVYGIRSK
ncbi:uncharacterized protein F4822DRAFT_443198 [Hypoxylon trugodes]|uniref:uncharacterized protein n=1 Tax=Hypoxylon trugodes TaxID=326681 RepID=UPI002190E256|nr:uncharacterized protein F4822DRAFT_443198 [Hypoxylon trugodes]KAI1390294.1 hypothetical protein F4822DRAFT_443198 [Hypoxylon trugodes]